MFSRKKFIEVALGLSPADLVIKEARIFNSFTGSFVKGDLAVSEGRVVAVGQYRAQTEIEADGRYLLPGFMDSHVHIESSMCSPAEFAGALAISGTTTAIADPHEIANVAGTKGLNYFLNEAEKLPISIYFMLPSCVPATPLEKGGASLLASDLAPYLEHPKVLGLAEMMNYPGVISRNQEVLDKLNLSEDLLIDGHAPGLTGHELAAYAASGIKSDHECVTPQEAQERLKLGLAVMLREGTAAKNLLNLLSAINTRNSRFCLLATDDRHAQDLVTDGSINYLVRLAHAQNSLELADILNMASLNCAQHFGLKGLGALAPTYWADMALYPDLENFRPDLVFKKGRLIAEKGQLSAPLVKTDDQAVRHSVNPGPIEADDFKIKASGPKVRVIGLVPGEIITKSQIRELVPINGYYESDPDSDIIKIATINRYRTAKPALGFISGLGLKKGALASTVSHDSHNLVVAGYPDQDMCLAAKTAVELGGGLVMAEGGRIICSLALPLGGLMSDLPITEVAAILRDMIAKGPLLGLAPGFDPFMILAFMSLPVIPSLKLTCEGLVDVATFSFVPTVFGTGA